MSTLRKDPVSNGWVIMSEERGRFAQAGQPVSATRQPRDHCPFCEGREAMTPPEIAAYREPGTERNRPGWRVRAIPNQYAALRIEGEQDRRADGIYDLMNGIGAHEVIVETPDHDAHIAEYPAGKTIEVLTMYRDRARDLQGDQRFRYIQLFRNHGMSAGAPISHPHSQLIALPITPRWVKEELVCAKSHWQSKERCLFCDILRQEERDGSRIVWQNGDFLSFAPFAAKFPFETWILPRRHSCEFNRTEDRELGPLAETICNTLWAIRAALNDPPFNYIIHSAPRLTPDRYAAGAISIEKDYHWHIEVIPRVTRMAGFEWGTGFYINPTLPETAAAYLREMLEERKREQG